MRPTACWNQDSANDDACHDSIHATQLIGAPLYWINRELFYGYMSLTKQSFGLLITTMTHWWGPTTIRISGDASVADEMRKTEDGLVEFSFPERMVMIANHQVCWSTVFRVSAADSPSRSTQTGFTFGGSAMRTAPRCTALYTSF